MNGLDVRVLTDPAALADAVAAALAESLVAAIAARGRVDVVLTGGGIGIESLRALRRHLSGSDIDWRAVHLWWGDERYRPAGDPDRNETQAREALLDAMPIPSANIHAMPSAGDDPQDAALAYADELARHAPPGQATPAFDIVMLGVGPEGHVASLFPHAPALESARPVVAITDSPKPPPVRLSLTLSSIRAGREVWIIASGRSKAEAVARCANPTTSSFDVPAAGARGREATVLWVDAEAAASLP